MDTLAGGEAQFLTQVYELLATGEGGDIAALIEKRRTELDISQQQVARVTGINMETLRRIISGEAQKVDVLTLLKLSIYLEMDMDGLARMFVAGMKPEDVGELEQTRRRNYIVRMFDLPGLKKVNFIESVADFDAIERRIVRFFKLDSIFEYGNKVIYPLFSRTKRTTGDKMRDFWVGSARCQFAAHPNPNDFDKSTLLDLVPQIAQYTRYEKTGLKTVAAALFRAGVTVICQSYLPGTQVRGATFLVDDKPYIVLTDFNRSLATVWFCLMHELAHVIYHWDQLKVVRYHLSGEDDLFLMENEANFFAREMLFPSEKRRYADTIIDNPQLVAGYARQNNVHPTIIYALNAHETQEYFRYAQYKVDPTEAIHELKCGLLEQAEVGEDVERVMKSLAR
jgi:HTH-type transcriptional regulator/antitoxin HigA